LLTRLWPLALVLAACLPAAAQTFTRVTNELRIAQSDPGAIVWFDYDNDGWPDVLCAGGSGGGYGNRLFHNNHNGHFTQLGETNFPGQGAHAFWTTVADFNDDGYLDIVAANWPSAGAENPTLYWNQGSGRFTKVQLNPSTILEGTDVRGGTVTALDYNGDGFVDLALGRYDIFTRNYLLKNTGGGVFSAITNTAWTLQAVQYESISSADYDGDGAPDLLCMGVSGIVRPFLFRNAGAGDFTRVTNSLLSTFQSTVSLTATWGDYDNDGDLDVAINYVSSSPTDLQVFLNDGSGNFTLGFSLASALCQYIHCMDYDNDGKLDIFITGYNSACRLYRNLGGGAFTAVQGNPLVQDVFGPYAVAGWGDYNNDGFMDVLVGAQGSPNWLYRNSPNGNHWLKVKLTGQASNRAAIGAVVRVKAIIGGQEVWQMRVVQAQSSFTEIVPHFGLGDATNVDLVRIEWPSGIVQQLTNVPGSQSLTITEHQEEATTPPSLAASKSGDGKVQLSVIGQPNLLYVFEASTDLVQWTKIAVRTNLTGTLEFTPPTSSGPRQFYRVLMP
jgi:enediyne biosynthesis protein E4